MPSDFSRARRVGEQMQRELAQLIQQELKDPRLGMVTVSAVKVSKDMSYATVYFTVLGESESIETSLHILEKAAGFLRHELSKRIRLRVMPALRFHYDESISEGNRLASLIESVSEHHKQQDDDGEETQ